MLAPPLTRYAVCRFQVSYILLLTSLATLQIIPVMMMEVDFEHERSDERDRHPEQSLCLGCCNLVLWEMKNSGLSWRAFVQGRAKV